jgi:hypothetical protein
VSGWAAWAQNIAEIYRVYERPAGACGMVSNEELCFLETYARFSFTGAGKIVDLGCWLGATTLALARGVADNPQSRWKRPIEAFDRFVWEPWMTPIAVSLGCRCYPDGESFLEQTRTILKPYEGLIRLRDEDLLGDIKFRDPIEFLFVDAMKSWDLANSITRNFLPRLIPGRSLLVHQDFAYHSPVGTTIHLMMWMLRDYFVPVYHVPNSCSVVYFLHRPLVRRRDLPLLDLQAVTPDLARQAFEYSLGVVGGEAQREVRLCKVLFFIERGWLEEAWEEAQTLVNSGGPISGSAAHDVRDLVTRKQRERIREAERVRLAELEALLCAGTAPNR